MGFVLSNRPHFNRVYLVAICKRSSAAVFLFPCSFFVSPFPCTKYILVVTSRICQKILMIRPFPPLTSFDRLRKKQFQKTCDLKKPKISVVPCLDINTWAMTNIPDVFSKIVGYIHIFL